MGLGTYGAPGLVPPEVATIRAIYDAFALGDVESALAHMAHDVRMELPGTAQRAGRTEPYVGHDGVRTYWADAGAVWDELSLHADDVRATSGGVVVFGHVSGRIGGAAWRQDVLWTWRVRADKAVWVRVNQLGASGSVA